MLRAEADRRKFKDEVRKQGLEELAEIGIDNIPVVGQMMQAKDAVVAGYKAATGNEPPKLPKLNVLREL